MARNKREFIQRMLPVVDDFRMARDRAPPTSDLEEQMHDSFGSLLKGILTVVDKYGYKEYFPGKRGGLDSHPRPTLSIIRSPYR